MKLYCRNNYNLAREPEEERDMRWKKNWTGGCVAVAIFVHVLYSFLGLDDRRRKSNESKWKNLLDFSSNSFVRRLQFLLVLLVHFLPSARFFTAV